MGLEICGVDEVGRGALAGPIFAAAVIFPPRFPPSLKDSITDSKRIPRKRRLYLARKITEYGCVGIGRSDVEEIEEGAIVKATLTAMKRAIETLSIVPRPSPHRWTAYAFDVVSGDCGDARGFFVASHWRGVDRGQGDSRRVDDGSGATLSGFWVGSERRIPDSDA